MEGTSDILQHIQVSLQFRKLLMLKLMLYRVSPKKLTLLNSLPNKKCEIFSGHFHISMAKGLIYHMTPENLKIVSASVSTGHFC